MLNLITRKFSFNKLFNHTIDFNLKTLDESDPYRFPLNGLSCSFNMAINTRH